MILALKIYMTDQIAKNKQIQVIFSFKDKNTNLIKKIECICAKCAFSEIFDFDIEKGISFMLPE